MNDAEIRLSVKIDDSTANKSMDTLSKKTDNLSKSFTNAGKKLTAGLTVPILAMGTLAVKNASDLSETMNKVDVAFGDSANGVKEWGDTTIKQFGIAKGTALDMAALYGDMATGMGMNTSEASELSTNLTGLAGDLASFKNISIDVAKTALAGVFTGETESLKQLGIIMTQTNLEQYAQSVGITKSMDNMTEAEKIQLRYAFVVDRSKNAVGDFERTSDSTANQTRIAQETFKELSAEIGEKLIPQFNKMLSTGLKIMDWFKNLNDDQKNMIITIAKIVAVLGPALIILGKIMSLGKTFMTVSKVIGAVTKSVWLFNSALLANPITWIVLGIVALIGMIILLIKYWDEISAVVGIVFSTIGGFFSNLFTTIGTFFVNAWTSFIAFITPVIEFINSAIQIIIGILNIPYQFLINIFILIVALVATLLETIYNIIMPIVMWIYNTILLPIFNFFVSIFTTIINFITGVIETIKNVFLTIVGFIWNNVLSPVFNFFVSVFGTIWGVISGVIEKIKNGFMIAVNYVKGLFNNLKDAVATIFGAVAGIIKAPINGIIELINGVLKGLNKIKVPDWVPGLGGKGINFPMIPKLSVGTNYVAQEGLAYLHQGEAVVPKKYNPAIGNGVGNSQPIIINNTIEAKVNEGTLFQAKQRIDYNKNLQTQFGGA